MLFAKSHIELNNVRNSIERIKRVSDGLVKIGPFGFVIDPLRHAAYDGPSDFIGRRRERAEA